MKKEEFKNYLLLNGKAPSTTANRIANCQNIENYYGDLDELFKDNKLEKLIKILIIQQMMKNKIKNKNIRFQSMVMSEMVVPH